MDPIMLVIRLLGNGYAALDLKETTQTGYYALTRQGVIEWVDLGDNMGQATYILSELMDGARSGELVPIFHLNNLGANRPWPQRLYPELAQYNLEVFQVAAEIYRVFLGGTHSLPGTVPSETDLVRAANAVLGAAQRFGSAPAIIDVAAEVATRDVCNDTNAPWAQRTVYRCPGRRTFVVGAKIDLSEPRDAHGEEIVDFQDVFVALAPLADFLRCPTPSMVLNASDDHHIKRWGENLMTGVIGPLRLTVQDDLEVKAPKQSKGKDEEADSDLGVHVDAVVSALRAHRIILTKKAVTRIYSTTLYVETAVPLSVATIYATGMLYPHTHLQKFYINELGNYAANREHDVLYYRAKMDDGTELNTHVYIVPLAAKAKTPSWPTHKYGDKGALQLYTVTIEHTRADHIARFENDLIKLLYAMTQRPEDVELIASLVQDKPPAPAGVVPPHIGTYTRQFTRKARGSGIRSVGEANRPLYVPRRIAGDEQLSLDLARLYSAAFHNGPSHVYMSVEGQLVKLDDIGGRRIDPFSAYYVSAVTESPVIVNKVQDGTTVMPGVHRKDKQANPLDSPRLRGLLPGRDWVADAPYSRRGNRSFFGALHKFNSDLARGADPVRLVGGPERAAALCRPELFDHTTDEIIQTFDEMDSRIHFRLAEAVVGHTILIATVADAPPSGKEAPAGPYSVVKENTIVELEIPRHAGIQLRDFAAWEKTILLLKFRDVRPTDKPRMADKVQETERWCYVRIFQSPHAQLPDGSGRTIEMGQASVPTLDSETRHELLMKQYIPRMAAFSFAERKVVHPVLDRGHLTLIEAPVICLHQSINADGYTTAITIRGPGPVVAGRLQGRSRAVVSRPSTEVVVTVGLVAPVIPLACPVTGAHYHAPPILLKHLPAGLDAATGVLQLSDQFFVTAGPAVAEPNGPEVCPLMDYQRPMTVLLSLLSWCILQRSYAVQPGEAGPVRVGADEIAKTTQFLEDYARMSDFNRPVTEIKVKNRFPPDVRGYWSLEAAVRRVVMDYMPQGIPLDNDTLARVFSYMTIEADWIRSHAPAQNSIRYIAGIHDMVPAERIYPSLTVRQTYRPAKEGLKSIVETLKQYDYAVSRFAARQNLDSWMPFVDLTGAPNADDLADRSCFVMRMPSGAVIYAFYADSKESSIRVQTHNARVHGMGHDYVVPVIYGYAALKAQAFRTDTILVAGTSTSETQGSLYNIHAFAPARDEAGAATRVGSPTNNAPGSGEVTQRPVQDA
jgi:hypothetical protein